MANTGLSRTFGTPTNNLKWTFSAWIKRSNVTTTQNIFSARIDGSNFGMISINSSGFLDVASYIGGWEMRYVTNRVFRDTNAFYHLCVSNDSSLASPETKIYINGVLETSFSTSDPASQNEESMINKSGVAHWVGQNGNNQSYFDGSMSHMHFIDGTAYDASYFGSTDSTTGEWKINTSPSVTYGTNGFFILKDGNSDSDQSGNINNFFTASGSLTKTEDSPSNVFATLNPLDTADGTDFSSLLQNGNTTLTGSANDKGLRGTLGALSGKFYWEIKANDEGDTLCVARSDVRLQIDNTSGSPSAGFWGVQSNGTGNSINTYENGTFSNSNALQGYASDTIIGIALDMDNGKIYYSFNGVFKGRDNNSSDPANQTNPFFSSLPTDGTFIMPFTENRSSGGSTYYNFGNGLFGTTAITTNSGNGYEGAEGASKFNYQPPTGYSALNTKGLNQ